MRATVMFGAGDVRIENVPDARLIEPTDAVVTVTRACICGSDLWPYKTMEHTDSGRVMGHEAIGIVEAVGADVRTIKAGDLVVMPFAYSDGNCIFCHEGLQASCIHGGFFGTTQLAGAQAEAVRIPQADGTLFVLPVGKEDALMPSLLTLSDVMGTGHHAAVAAKVRIDPLFQANAPARAFAASVTFEPGARTAWHTHPLGQTLLVTAGCGWAQREGGPIEEIRPGDVVCFPPGERHWHGAAPTTAMTHIAIQEQLDGKVVDWMEKVSDEQYRG